MAMVCLQPCRIEAGKCLGKVSGNVLRMEQVTEEQTSYVIDLGQDKVLDPFGPFRNLNHSCNPNARVVALRRHDVCRCDSDDSSRSADHD